METATHLDIYLGRQPILDREQQIVAYELLFRSGQQNAAHITDDLAASAAVISHAFNELGIQAALGQYTGYINADRRLLDSDLVELLPRNKVVLEILEHTEITPSLIRRCKELRDAGFTLAMDDVTELLPEHMPLLEVVKVVKVDILALDPAKLFQLTARLKLFGVKLLAEKVDSAEQHERCLELGFDLFQGYYFAKPQVLSGKKLNHSELTLMRLMALLLDDAETTELEAVLKQEPGLIMNLMRLTNSVATGTRHKITSLGHAITVLGRRQLLRWLQLLLYTADGMKRGPSPLLQLAAVRGRLMERVAARLQPGVVQFEDQAFMTGIMSLMPALLGLPMQEILGSLHVAPEVRGALTEHKGVLGLSLALVEKLETGDFTTCARVLRAMPGLTVDELNHFQSEAMAWANGIGTAA